jgi:hypothetical protein
MTVTLKEFFAEWAAPCAEQKSITESLAAKYDNVDFWRINIEATGNRKRVLGEISTHDCR